jgi:FKBP-type peptidyl-prolyl cis-trans isomerase FkpA
MKSNLLLLCLAILLGSVACKKGGSVKSTINGHKYTIIQDENGPNAKEGDYVYFTYMVRAKDSVVFNSAMQAPVIKFKLPKIEKTDDLTKSQPILELLINMSKGDSATVSHVIDENVKKQIGIPDISQLEYDVKLVDIKTEAEYAADMEVEAKERNEKIAASQALVPEIEKSIKMTIEDFKSGKNKDQVITTASGLKYIVHTTGSGEKPEIGKLVSVNYYGSLMDGTRFDDSWSRGQEFSFPIGQGQVIKGWDEGVSLLPIGSKATFFIPYALAYGEAGSPPTIPAKSDLVFYVELNGVK